MLFPRLLLTPARQAACAFFNNGGGNIGAVLFRKLFGDFLAHGFFRKIGIMSAAVNAVPTAGRISLRSVRCRRTLGLFPGRCRRYPRIAVHAGSPCLNRRHTFAKACKMFFISFSLFLYLPIRPVCISKNRLSIR